MRRDSQNPDQRDRKRPLWRRTWVFVTGGIFLLLVIISALAGEPAEEPTDRAARDDATPTATPTPSPTPDPAEVARAAATGLAEDGDHSAAAGVLEDAGLKADADRVLRRGARTLYRQARRALGSGRYKAARRLAIDARQLHRTSAITALVDEADTKIAEARAAAQERRRLARIARDEATCTSGEKSTVRAGGGVPAGCGTYAADLEARRAAREAERQEEQAAADANCEPGYDPCVPPYPPDVDCPDVGPVTVTGPDPHGLDADNDGVACGGD